VEADEPLKKSKPRARPKVKDGNLLSLIGVSVEPEQPVKKRKWRPKSLDAHENEPACAWFSEPTECAGMIRCDALIWDKLDQGGFQQLHRMWPAQSVIRMGRQSRIRQSGRSAREQEQYPAASPSSSRSHSLVRPAPRAFFPDRQIRQPPRARPVKCWPRLRGHPLGLGLDWPEHGGILHRSGSQGFTTT
jgi:hypothetical protein